MNFIAAHFLLLIALVWLIAGLCMDYIESSRGDHL